MISVPKKSGITDQCELITVKRKNIKYQATLQYFHLKNAAGKPMDLIFQVSDDGVAFATNEISTANAQTVKVKGNGGFVLTLAQ